MYYIVLANKHAKESRTNLKRKNLKMFLQQKIVGQSLQTNRVHHLRSYFPVSEVFPRWLCTDHNTVITCKDLTQHLLRRCKESWPIEMPNLNINGCHPLPPTFFSMINHLGFLSLFLCLLLCTQKKQIIIMMVNTGGGRVGAMSCHSLTTNI